MYKAWLTNLHYTGGDILMLHYYAEILQQYMMCMTYFDTPDLEPTVFSVAK